MNEAETRRRKIHNHIEDLKGAIRVFCRVRPLSDKEKNQDMDTNCVTLKDSTTLEVPKGGVFAFDSVWAPGEQLDVFKEAADLVQSALDGYNVTVFAYGQTGAGKTYTMTGKPDDPGLIGRFSDEIFRLINKDKARYNVKVHLSMMELYVQDLIDLLGEEKSEDIDAIKQLGIEHVKELKKRGSSKDLEVALEEAE